MYKTLTKLTFITFSILGLFVMFSPKVDASLNVNSFYPQDDNMIFSISDPATGISTFVIKGDDSTFPEGSTATTLDFEFEAYDTYTDEKFEIFVDKDGIGPNSSYGNDYYVDVNSDKPIRVLPSTVNYDFKYNNTIGTISLFSKYYNIDKINRIKTTPDIEYYPPGTDIELINASIDIELKLVIPLKLKDPSHKESKKGVSHGVLSDDAYRSGRAITDEVIASIQVSSSGIIFDHGLDSMTSDELRITDEEKGQRDKGTKEEFKPVSDEGFQGHGILPPTKNTYKGISNVTDLNEFIIGLANFVLTFVAVVCVLMLTYGGYLWIIDRGEEQLAEKARKIIAGAVLGLLIIISAYTLVNTLINLDANSSSGAIIEVSGGIGSLFD